MLETHTLTKRLIFTTKFLTNEREGLNAVVQRYTIRKGM